MDRVLMCVPNVSEGRDLGVVEQIAAPLREAPGIRLLECTPDPHHNRTVLCYIGEPERVLAVTQELATRAFALIDMTRHRGAHPRLGAVDVVPFVPVRGMEMAEAVEIARRFGRFVGSLGVPVYYYEEAATRPERRNLADIRKGEYEALPVKLQDPVWQPDEGPAAFNPKAGALVTGARFPLIALNVNLRTTDLSVAERIARAVRHSSGGYRFVRAIALPLEDRGLVQVSMNLTDYRRTPIPRVLETVRCEAVRYGVAVAGSEIVGPVPVAALEEVVRYYLQAHDFAVEQIIECALLGADSAHAAAPGDAARGG